MSTEKPFPVTHSQDSEKDDPKNHFSRVSTKDFKKIPGSPIAYWVSQSVRDAFAIHSTISLSFKPFQGLITGDTERFCRLWFEVCSGRSLLSTCTKESASSSGKRWFIYNKGGSYRKWYGNRDFVVDWESDGTRVKSFDDAHGKLLSRPQNEDFYFMEGLTWTAISSSYFAVRYCPNGSIGSNAGMMIVSKGNDSLFDLLGLLNSFVSTALLKTISQTLNFDQGLISRLPYCKTEENPALTLIDLARTDWDNYETSWDFQRLPLLRKDELRILNDEATDERFAIKGRTLFESWKNWNAYCRANVARMKELEEENNRLWIEAYSLQDELTPEVPLEEITLTCNFVYRYGKGRSDEEYEALLRRDTMREFISYAVGCMFGRYSLDAPGLILANQGETVEDYVKKVESVKCEVESEDANAAGQPGGATPHSSLPTPHPKQPTSHSKEPTSHAKPQVSFMPDANNILPILDDAWFSDGIVEQFNRFLRVTFGEENFQENLHFIEDSLDERPGKRMPIRKYFVSEFYKHHVTLYKRRPIYWLFQSPKKSFQALIYMHRYNRDTVNLLLNQYLRDFQNKLRARRDNLQEILATEDTSAADKTKATKETAKIDKTLTELADWERDVIYPLATQRIEIDLDDGVKQNYPKFGNALANIPGLS